MILQDHQETAPGVRVIAIPTSVVDMLRRRSETRAEAGRGDDHVFPTDMGNLRDPRNTSRD